jgi:Bacterial DNA-binding protein
VKQKRKARTGFNPKTQQKIKIPVKTVVKFRVAKAAKDGVLAKSIHGYYLVGLSSRDSTGLKMRRHFARKIRWMWNGRCMATRDCLKHLDLRQGSEFALPFAFHLSSAADKGDM